MQDITMSEPAGKYPMTEQIRAAILLLLDEGFRVWENHKYVDFDGEENGKNVWVVMREGKPPLQTQIDFYSAEEAVKYFMESCGYE